MNQKNPSGFCGKVGVFVVVGGAGLEPANLLGVKDGRPCKRRQFYGVKGAISPTRRSLRGITGSIRTNRTSREIAALHDPLLAAQFWKFVDVRADGVCWFWRGAKQMGYGRFRGVRAHRFAYEVGKGAIPPDLMVRHLCGNKLCVNPRHLEVGTMADNARDGVELGETLRGSANGKSKLSEEDVRYIRTNPDNLSGRNLAVKFGVSPATISLIRSGRRWGHFEPPEEWTSAA